ncbi:MAG: YbhB/YbcL family Raf kinase inhibitor-like protein [Candidatus Magasanikbacteria bacterium]|nr:YbhB/YbcL family Raf kinase inhibitor-like protein [Candidatus Magasanikbacteria bacterium]
MQIVSPAFAANDSIPAEYTCDGGGHNPPLEFLDVPTDAKSLVLIMEDPDVPHHLRADGMFDHWVVWNIPPETREVAQGKNPPGESGANTRGATGYTPPCPPDREHRYFFKLFALSARLDLPSGATKSEVLVAAQNFIIAEAELIGRYNRS